MSFETEAISYVKGLCTSGTFISGSITGIKEDLFTATAIVSVIIDTQVTEKKIIIYKENDVFVWKYLNAMDRNPSNLDYRETDWNYPSYVKRIVAPVALIMDDMGIKMYGWFQLNSLPIVLKATTVYLYCNTILPEHQYVIDLFQGVVTVETKP